MKDSYGELLSFMIFLWSFLSRLLYHVHQLYINEPLYIIMKSAIKRTIILVPLIERLNINI